jgi:hypothetical protein
MKYALILFLLAITAHADTTAVAKKPAVADTAKAPANGLAQGVREPKNQFEVGARIIYEILYGDTASTLKYFEDSVAPNLTKETFEAIRSQFSWLPRMIGDNLEQLMAGPVLDSTDKPIAYFREYRMANESNRRAPLLVIHVWFADSTTMKAAGAFVKSFLDSDKRIGNEEVWKTQNGDSIEIFSVTMVEFKEAMLMALNVYDDDTVAINRERALKKAIPIVKEAIARGMPKKAAAELKEGQKLMDEIGVNFIRRDPRLGFTHYKFAIAPKQYMDSTEFTQWEAAQKAKEVAGPKKDEPKAKPPSKSPKKSK